MNANINTLTTHQKPLREIVKQQLSLVQIHLKRNQYNAAQELLKTLANKQAELTEKQRMQIKLYQAQTLIETSHLITAEKLLKAMLPEDNNLSSLPWHDIVAAANYQLATLYILQGKIIEADLHLKNALAGYRRIVNADHPVIGRTLHALAIVRKGLGDFEAAEKLYLEVIKNQRSVLGDQHPSVATTRLEYSLMLTAQGRTSDAETQSNQAIELLTAINDQTQRLGYAYSSLGFAQFRAARFTAAKQAFDTAISLIEQHRGAHSVDLPPGLIKLAEIAIQQQQFAVAQQKITRAINLLEAMQASGPYGLIKALSVQAELLQLTGQNDAALETAERYIELLQMRLAVHRNTIVNLALDEQREVRDHFKRYLDIAYEAYQTQASGHQSPSPNPLLPLAERLFTVAQYPHMTGTANAIKYMASRVSIKDEQLQARLREREQLVADWEVQQARR